MAFKRMRLNPDTGKTWPKKPKRNRNDFLFVTKRREFSCFFVFGFFEKQEPYRRRLQIPESLARDIKGIPVASAP